MIAEVLALAPTPSANNNDRSQPLAGKQNARPRSLLVLSEKPGGVRALLSVQQTRACKRHP